MNNVFHEGEDHIQEVMSVKQKANTLTSMIKDSIPKIAADFLRALKFCVITLNTKPDDLFSTVIYNHATFIEVLDYKKISIKINHKSHIPESFFNEEILNIGMIGLEHSSAKRIRINGKAKIIDNQIIIDINEIYSNCPKYIKRRILEDNFKILDKETVNKKLELNQDLITMISNADEFYLASGHKEKGLDISYKGGEKGFVKVLSSKQLQFDDLPGNNLYNSLGNIYTNPYINMFFIDFENNNTYNILATATIKELSIDNKKRLRVDINCIDITINENSFSLDYR
jgi:predicted pyridoxine 5'-phosphate oxidase superfamily flavin-nucleotide-binding protein